MRIIVLAGAVFMTSGTAAYAKEPRFVGETARATEDLAGCIALKVAETRGYEVVTKARSDGLDLKMRFRITGIAATAATFQIDDLGSRRRLTIYASGKSTGAPRQIAEQAAKCASWPE